MFHLPNAHGGEFPRTYSVPVCRRCQFTDHLVSIVDSDSYTNVAKAPEAHEAALKAATAIAVVGARIIGDAGFAKETRSTWEKQMKDIEAEKVMADVRELLAPYRKTREA